MNARVAMILMSLFVVSIATAFTMSGGYEIDWHTIDSGGGVSTGSGFELAGTIGQPDAGSLAGGGYTLQGGYWHSENGPVPCIGDCGNPNGVVDVLDLLALLGAWGQPGNCDSNGDNTTDVLDLLALLGAWGTCP